MSYCPVEVDRRKSPYSTKERLLIGMNVDADGCWIWQGFTYQGYGRITVDGMPKRAYKVAYEEWRGPVPKGAVLDHICHDPKTCAGGNTCKHRRCINPAHLKVTTHKDNVSPERAVSTIHYAQEAKRKITHCKRGHLLEGSNVSFYNAGRQRKCLVCKKEDGAKYRELRREKKNAQEV